MNRRQAPRDNTSVTASTVQVIIFCFHISRKKNRIQIDNSIFLTTWLSYSSNSSGLVLIDTWKLVYKNTIPHGCQLSNQVFFISLKYYNSWTKLLGRCYRVPSSSEVVDTMEPNPFWSRIQISYHFRIFLFFNIHFEIHLEIMKYLVKISEVF